MRGVRFATWGYSTGVGVEKGLRHFFDVRVEQRIDTVPYSRDILPS